MFHDVKLKEQARVDCNKPSPSVEICPPAHNYAKREWWTARTKNLSLDMKDGRE